MILEVSPLHISVDHMDAQMWLLFGIILGPPLLLLVVTGFLVHRDARELPDTDDPPSRADGWWVSYHDPELRAPAPALLSLRVTTLHPSAPEGQERPGSDVHPA